MLKFIIQIYLTLWVYKTSVNTPITMSIHQSNLFNSCHQTLQRTLLWSSPKAASLGRNRNFECKQVVLL